MPVFQLEFEVFCSCGNGLCNNTIEGANRHSQYITVEPCEKCLNIAREEGYEEGYEECQKENEL